MDKHIDETKDITPVPPKGIVSPIVSIEDALSMWHNYEALKSKIATQNDIQQIQGKSFLKKSFWRKMSKFFGLSLECVKEDFDKELETWFVTYRATARTGDFMDGDGACSLSEKGRRLTLHDSRATSHTRAKNRAIADLIGGGEVSAEEVIAYEDIEQEKETPKMTIAKDNLERHPGGLTSKFGGTNAATEKQVNLLYYKLKLKGFDKKKAEKWIEEKCEGKKIPFDLVNTLLSQINEIGDEDIPF